MDHLVSLPVLQRWRPRGNDADNGPLVSPHLQLAAVMLAAMPMMGIYPILAQSYGKEDLGAAALLATTVASFFTLSGLLWLTQ